jgi:hypothetical protein
MVAALPLCFLASAFGQTNQTDSQAIRIIRRGSQPSRQGSADHFTGIVRVDRLFRPHAPARASGALVTFEPGARTVWHTHPLGSNPDRHFGHRPGAALGRPR